MYLLALGGILIGAPNTLLRLFGLPATTEPWIHVLGVTVMAIGMLNVASARAEQMGFFRAGVWVRVFVFAAFVAFALIGIVPPVLVLFGVIDVVGALWTHVMLRRAATAP